MRCTISWSGSNSNQQQLEPAGVNEITVDGSSSAYIVRANTRDGVRAAKVCMPMNR